MDEDGGNADRIPLGDDCGVPFRCSGGDLLASTRLRALPNEEALCSVDSKVGEYRAYCWMTS